MASCGGRWVPERLLTIVARLPDDDLYAALRETVEHQLLVVDPSGRGYGFRHSLARAAIHDDLLPGERAQLHRLYAEAIEGNTELSDPGLDAISMLAHHWLAAHDLPRALSASVRAGRVAADAYAPSAARRHYELALELWTQVPDADQRAGIQHPELLDAAADAAWRAGSVDRALALVDEALEEVGYGGTLEQRALLLARRASILRELSRDDEGIAVLEQAVGLLPPDLPSRAGARVLGQLAAAMLRVDQMQRAGELGARAMTAAEAVGATEEQLDAQITVGHAAVFAGEVEAGLAQMRAAIDRARQLGTRWNWVAIRAFVNLSDLLLMLGRYQEAVATADEGIAVAEEAGVTRTAGALLRSNKAEALLRSGRWAEALAAAAPEREAAGTFTASLLLLRIELNTLAGRTEAAHADLREVRQHLRSTTAPQFALPLATVEAELARAEGRLDEARASVDARWRGRRPARSRGTGGRCCRWVPGSKPSGRSAHLMRADPSRRTRRSGRRCCGRKPRTWSARTPAARGHLALVRAEHARLTRNGEVEAWTEAVDACREMNEPFPLAYALTEAGGGVGRRGQRGRRGRGGR